MRPQLFLTILLVGVTPFLSGATLQEFSGTVKVMRLFRTLNLKTGMELKGKDMIITGDDGTALIKLKDESTLNLGADTRFKLSSLKGEGKADRKVELDLIQGAGVFNVTPLKGEESFSIRTPSAVAGVRGTRFGVRHVRVGRRFVSSVAVIKGRVAVSPVRRTRRRASGRQRKEVMLTTMTQSSVSAEGGVQEPQPLSRQEALQIAGEAGMLPSGTSSEGQDDAGGSVPPGSTGESGAEESLFDGVATEVIESNPLPVIVPVVIPTVITRPDTEGVKNTVEQRSLRIPTPPSPPSQTEAQ